MRITMNENRFIFDAVRQYAETRATDAALIFGERVTSYADLGMHTSQVANGLASLGLNPQSRIAIITGNNDFFFEILLGAALGNFVLTPINARLAPPEVAYIIRRPSSLKMFRSRACRNFSNSQTRVTQGIVRTITSRNWKQ